MDLVDLKRVLLPSLGVPTENAKSQVGFDFLRALRSTTLQNQPKGREGRFYLDDVQSRVDEGK